MQIDANGKIFFVYSSENNKSPVLLPHHRRDLGIDLNVWVTAPVAERDYFDKTRQDWTGMSAKRFHSS